MNDRFVLITGCSTGIGAACAVDLDRAGWRVFAGVRSEDDARRLRAQASPRLETVAVEMTDGASLRAAAERVGAAAGEAGLAGLVNNAGIIVPGPLELVPPAELRRQFEVNVVGHVALIQAALPLLRRGRGRIVLMSSISGRIAPPYMGAYAASKHAIEAIADALRLELRTWGIRVSVVEPDSTDTPIWNKMLAGAEDLQRAAPPERRGLYEHGLDQLHRAAERLDKSSMPVERVVRAVRHALSARRPKTRYPVGWRTRAGFAVFPKIPDRIRDWLLMKFMGIE